MAQFEQKLRGYAVVQGGHWTFTADMAQAEELARALTEGDSAMAAFIVETTAIRPKDNKQSPPHPQ